MTAQNVTLRLCSSHPLRGAVFVSKRFSPGTRKTQPRVERFVRHPGVECLREGRTPAGVEDYFLQHWS